MSTKIHEPPSAPRTAPWHAPSLLRRVGSPGGDGTGDDPSHYIEARWPVTLAVIVAAILSATLDERLTLGPVWVAPLIEGALLAPLLLTEPHWHPAAGWPWQRIVATLLIGVLNAFNLASLVLLIDILLHGGTTTGASLIQEAGQIWITNILVFALWYWQLDRGGPQARHWREARVFDFLFPQMSNPNLAPPGWMPTFTDYLYVAFTNATAFSPTDTLPLTPAAKLLMGIQALISLLTVALVAARAVNILT